MADQKRQFSFQSVVTMDSYTPSTMSADELSPSLNHSPLASSPLTIPETADLEDAPPLGLSSRSDSSDPTFVLVVGGLGFIGSHTVLELLRTGYNGMLFFPQSLVTISFFLFFFPS